MNRLTIEERRKANKIRCKLLYTIDRDIRETKKNNKKQLLINSMTLQEIEEKFLLFSNYKMKLSATFTKIANKYMVMKTVDNRLNQNFFYSDYLQELNKGTQYLKMQRKRISANNIIKIPLLEDTQEKQSPIPEIFTNKMNIGDKKLIKPEIFPNNNMNNNKLFISNEIDKNKDKNNNINDDDSINSLTFELIQKKANLFSPSLNNKNKKELKRRKNQLEAIRKLRQFCFQKLKNKRRCITKSSHQNLLYINNKFDEEDEKNNTSYSSKNNIKINNKIKNNTKTNKSKNYKSKNNSKRKDTINESKKKKSQIKKNKDKKKINDINSSGRKLFRNNSTKKCPFKAKKDTNERKSLIVTNNLISCNLDTDILRFKKKKKEKNEALTNNNPINKKDEDIIDKYIINHPKIKKKRTDVLGESFKEKYANKNQLIFNSNQKKNKYNNNVFFNNNNDINTNTNTNNNNSTKKNSSENNFFNRKTKTKHNPYSYRCLIKTIKKNKLGKSSECNERHRRYSTPNKVEKKDKKEQTSDRAINNHSYKKMNNDLMISWSKFDKKEKGHSYQKDKKTQKNNNEKIKLHNVMQKVDEEDY